MSLSPCSAEASDAGGFPMGFVHGDPLLPLASGYALRQLPSVAASIVEGEGYPDILYLPASPALRFHSMALAADSIVGLFAKAVEAGERSIRTGAYGELPVSLDPQGAPWTRGIDRLDLFHEDTVRYLRDFVREHVRKHAASSLNERILCWGLDNEWEGRANYSAAAREAFGRWLADAYRGDIAQLNQAWGAQHDDFAAAVAGPLPEDADYDRTAGRFLDWWHFQSRHFTGILADLARVAHEADPLGRGVVHKATQLTIEMPAWRSRIFDHALFAEQVRAFNGGFHGIDMYGHGDRQAYETSYVYHCIRPSDHGECVDRPCGVMLGENNNHDGPACQFAATQWRLLANGVKSMMFFTTGFAGAKDDWDHFGFTDAVTGRLKPKFFYAARWANLVRRTGGFWSKSFPAPPSQIPRLALLLPRRDILLSAPSDRNPGNPRYAYPRNHRWMVYRWLREQGYWVDVIPYTKLSAEFLSGYQGLCLVGAVHLSAEETDIIRDYVGRGGVLVADKDAGRYDEHHREVRGLDTLLGVEASATATGGGSVEIVDEHGTLFAKGAGSVSSFASGWGHVLYFPFELGAVTTRKRGVGLASVTSDAPTAESEEYAAFDGEFAIGRWLAGHLCQTGLRLAYRLSVSQEIARIEQPWLDAAGNCAIMITTRAQSCSDETIPASLLTLALPPGGPWGRALWAPAEHDGLEPVHVREGVTGGALEVELPPVAAAGVLYLFKETRPAILGIRSENGVGCAVDGLTLQVKPGVSFHVRVQNFGLRGATPLLSAPEGWNVSAPVVEAGGDEFVFEVTPQPDLRLYKPDELYSLVARLGDAEATTCVEVVPDPNDVPRLLTANASFPATWPWSVSTGATYRYLEPTGSLIADPVKPREGVPLNALTNGFSSIGGQRHSYHRNLPGETHFARYDALCADILFDLKAEHRLARVTVVLGPGLNTPRVLEVLSGNDGQLFSLAAMIELSVPRPEVEIPLPPHRARYVRIRVQWARAGGTLDEIEIWGV